MQYVKDNNSRNPKKLLDLAREILRRKHYGIRTEAAYLWMDETLYIFHSKPYPKYFVFSFMILLKDWSPFSLIRLESEKDFKIS